MRGVRSCSFGTSVRALESARQAKCSAAEQRQLEEDSFNMSIDQPDCMKRLSYFAVILTTYTAAPFMNKLSS